MTGLGAMAGAAVTDPGSGTVEERIATMAGQTLQAWRARGLACTVPGARRRSDAGALRGGDHARRVRTQERLSIPQDLRHLPHPRHPHRRAPAAPPTTPRPTVPAATRLQTRAIREWALANGYEISDRGRIPTDIEHAYHDAP